MQETRTAARPDRRRPVLVCLWVFILLDLLVITLIGTKVATTWASDQTEADFYAQFQKYARVTDDSPAPHVDFASLEKINPQVQAWLYIPAAQLSYPVVQGADNQVYRHRRFDGGDGPSGAIFLNTENQAPGGLDEQTTLYGNSLGAQMFGLVESAVDSADDFAKFDRIYYVTRSRVYVYRAVLARQIPQDFPAVGLANSRQQALPDYLAGLWKDAPMRAGDLSHLRAQRQVLTLVTSEYNPRNAQRSILVAGLEKVLDR